MYMYVVGIHYHSKSKVSNPGFNITKMDFSVVQKIMKQGIYLPE